MKRVLFIGVLVMALLSTTAMGCPQQQKVAEFEVADLTPAEIYVEPGESVAVEVTVKNVGEAAGSYKVELKVNDEVYASETVTLEPNKSTIAAFTVTLENEGIHEVSAHGQKGTITVRAIGIDPAELVENVVAASQGIETFQTEMSTASHKAGIIAGERFVMMMTTTGYGVIDLLNERMRTTMTTRVPIPVEARMPGAPEYMETVMLMYFVDGMIYTKVSMPEMPAFWTKREMPWRVSPVCQLVQLLKASEVELRGTEVVEGIDTFVVVLVPDMEKLLGIMAQQMGVAPQMMEEDMFKDITITQWICKDTFLPLRERAQTTMVMFEMTATTHTTTYYHSFNEPVSIVLPPEAAYAVETPMPQW